MKRSRATNSFAAPAGGRGGDDDALKPLSSFSFYVYNPVDKHAASFEVERYGGHPEEDAFYVLKFHRPGLKNIRLYTFYIVKDDEECLYAHSLNEPQAPAATRVLMDRKYLVYETYTLAQDTEEAGITFALYVQIQRQKHVHVDMGLAWVGKHVRRLKNVTTFHPWDIDVTKYGLKLDSRTVPQRTPLWFSLRGMTGTRAYTLLGYFVPSKEEDPNWTIDGDKQFSPSQKSLMRFGVDSEDKALMLYAHHFPEVEVQLTGLCKATTLSPRPPAGAGGTNLPSDWGASPDGLIVDPSHTWDDIPQKTRQYWDESEWKGRAAHGVLEIKCTPNGNDLSMHAYYFPQIYMEMMCAQTLWVDVMRYSRNGARVYRVYRHKPTEDTLVSLLKYAQSNAHRLRDILQEEPFVKIRDYFERLALTMSFVDLDVPPSYARVRAEYEAYVKAKQTEGQQFKVGELEVLKMKKQRVFAPPAGGGGSEGAFAKFPHRESKVVIPPGEAGGDHKKTQLDAIQLAHNTLYGLFNDPEQFNAVVREQITRYTSLLHDY